MLQTKKKELRVGQIPTGEDKQLSKGDTALWSPVETALLRYHVI